jgi:redox-sensitive bicupin YhaK (pirin superfamily)
MACMDIRHIAFTTAGHSHGPITRLMSPGDIGERIKPFVFLDHCVIDPARQPRMGWHPHSGIATITVPLSGGILYGDSTGQNGLLPAGGVEWMKAGGGVWHGGSVEQGEVARVFQLWIALPADWENSPAESQYVPPSQVVAEGPVRVILGSYGGVSSIVRAPDGLHYYQIQLADGERWRYEPPAGYTVAWLAVDQGLLHAPQSVGPGEMGVFEERDGGAIEVVAQGRTTFVFGTAIKHPHPLVMGSYSVHTSQATLAQGESEIRRIGQQLQARRA